MQHALRSSALAAAALLALAWPWLVPDFWVSTVATRTLIVGTMALSLSFLSSMTGMVSFAQAAVAAVAGYTMALLSANTSAVGLVLPLGWALLAALASGTLAGLLIGAISLRSQGIYLLMITLAISMSLYFFVSQNTTVFNGFDGVNGVRPPKLGTIDFASRSAFYLLSLAAALGCWLLCVVIERSPLGSILHGLRNAPLRMAALGHSTVAIRLVAFGIAGFIAAVSGVLNVWYSGQVSPGSTDAHAAVTLLIVAVIGGIRRPVGAFVGALFFVLLENFAMELLSRDRFNLVIGATFIAIVMFLADGLVGLPTRLRGLLRQRARRAATTSTQVA
jgi:branched-chain amino acid transport system permease protein